MEVFFNFGVRPARLTVAFLMSKTSLLRRHGYTGLSGTYHGSWPAKAAGMHRSGGWFLQKYRMDCGTSTTGGYRRACQVVADD